MPPLSCRRCQNLNSWNVAAFGLGIVLLIVLTRYSMAWGQASAPEWSVPVGTPDFDEVLGITALPSGVIVVGSTGGAFPLNQKSGGGDAFLSKYDSDGTALWTHQFGTSGADRATSVAADSSAIFISGSTTGTFSGETNSGNNLDAFVRKSNPQGFLLWTRQFGTLGEDQAAAITLDSTGVYVVGSVGGPAAGYFNPEGPDAFIRKYDFDGNLVWGHQFGAGGADLAWGVAVQPSGIYVAGSTSGAFPGERNHGGASDVFLRKYDLDGAEQWTRQAGTLGVDQVSGIAAGPQGIYLVGTTTGTFAGQSNFGGGTDTFLLCYDFEGNEQWVRKFGTEGADRAAGVVAFGNDIYLAGSTSQAFAGYHNVGGNLDGFLLKYNALGIRVWARQFGTPGIDRPSGIAAYAQQVYIAGNVDGAFPADSDGFITAVAIAGEPVPGVTPTTPEPAAPPEATPAPTATPTPVAAPAATPTPALAATPTPPPSPPPPAAAGPTPHPTAAPAPVPGPAAAATPTPRPTATPWPTQTPWPTLPPLDFPAPEDPEGASHERLILLGLIGLLALIALIGVVRKW